MASGSKQWVGGVAAVVLVCGVLFALKSGGSAQTDPGPKPPPPGDGFSTIETKNDAGRILIEAESAIDIARPVQIAEGVDEVVRGASSEKCCWVGPDKWNESWKPGQVEGEWRKGREKAPYPGFAKYAFTAPASTEYTVWIRVYWVDDCGNSLYIAFGDAGDLMPVESPTCGRWLWVPLRDAEMKPARIRLNEGENSLVICNREDNVYFDQILIRRADKKWPDPTGIEASDTK
jgi:hypothetical protein